MHITRPMGAADLTEAAEIAGKNALALSDLARSVAAYEAATGVAVAIVDADKAVSIGIDMAAGPDATAFFIPEDKPFHLETERQHLWWQGREVPAALTYAVQHIAKLGPSGQKWGFAQDLEMIERAIDGQPVKLVADVMEFSASHIRQRFNKLVDITHANGSHFEREQVRDALLWMLEPEKPKKTCEDR